MTMSLASHLRLPLPSAPKPSSSSPASTNPSKELQTPTGQICCLRPILLSNLLSLALSATFTYPLPSLAIPSFNSQPLQLPLSTTPFSQSKVLQLGLEDGKIRPCPSTNPRCVSTNARSSSFAFPWTIPESSRVDAIQVLLNLCGLALYSVGFGSCTELKLLRVGLQKLQEAILRTQKNPKIQVIEDTPNGPYLQAEVDGGFGRDVMEFLVKGEVVTYRAMATKVTYVYPFTTAIGDSKGQEERLKQILDHLGWYAPSFDSMD